MTSGNVSPSLGTPIGMAYVPNRLTEPGSEIAVEIRGKAVPARVVTLPFYAHKTKKIAASATSRRANPEDAAWIQPIAAIPSSTNG